MKKYNDYIYEGLNSKEYNDSYDLISGELTTFWSNLRRDFDKLNNGGITTSTTVKPEHKLIPPVKDKIYKYNTQTGKVETVKILVPDNGENTNTAIVQNVNKPGKMGQHTANWSRLTPTTKTT